MMKNGSSALALVFVMLASLSCGSSGNSGTGGSSGAGTGGASGTGTGGRTGSGGSTGSGGATGGTPLHVSCMAFCVADDNCKADTTIADCLSYTCPPAGEANTKDSLPQACQNAWIAYWDCLAKSANVCDQPGTCTAQADAFATACP